MLHYASPATCEWSGAGRDRAGAATRVLHRRAAAAAAWTAVAAHRSRRGRGRGGGWCRCRRRADSGHHDPAGRLRSNGRGRDERSGSFRLARQLRNAHGRSLAGVQPACVADGDVLAAAIGPAGVGRTPAVPAAGQRRACRRKVARRLQEHRRPDVRRRHQPRDTKQILHILVHEKVNATFFPTGVAMERFPEVWKAVAQDNFPIANHTYAHGALAGKCFEPQRQELARAAGVFATLGIPESPYMRPPYELSEQEGRTEAAAAAVNLDAVILWNVDTGDWQGASASTIRRIALSGGKGSIILMHTFPRRPRRHCPRSSRASRRAASSSSRSGRSWASTGRSPTHPRPEGDAEGSVVVWGGREWHTSSPCPTNAWQGRRALPRPTARLPPDPAIRDAIRPEHARRRVLPRPAQDARQPPCVHRLEWPAARELPRLRGRARARRGGRRGGSTG